MTDNEIIQRTKKWRQPQVGDRVIFKGEGLLFQVLSRIIKLMNPRWDRWGWHMATLVEKDEQGWWMMEATGSGVGKVRLPDDRAYRLYHWHEKPLRKRKVERFLKDRENQPYDADAYIGTVLATIWQKITGRRWRVHDDQYHCWELSDEFDRFMGKPWTSLQEYPLITTFIKKCGTHYYEYNPGKEDDK